MVGLATTFSSGILSRRDLPHRATGDSAAETYRVPQEDAETRAEHHVSNAPYGDGSFERGKTNMGSFFSKRTRGTLLNKRNIGRLTTR